MANNKTHWRKYHDTDYIGSYTLLDAGVENLNVIIEKVIPEGVKGPDGKTDQCVVAHLKDQKPLILNVTNCKSIAKIYSTPFIEEWSGKAITLYVKKVRAFGEFVEALRIRDKAPNMADTVAPTATTPAEKVEFTPEHERWAGARKAFLMGSVTVEQIKENYTLSKENEKLLTEPDEPPKKVKAETKTTETEAEVVEPEATELPTLNEKHKKWDGIRSALLDDITSLESVRKQYTISKEDELKLTMPPLK